MSCKNQYITLLKGLFLLCILLMCGQDPAIAQRISFSTWTGSDDITLRSPQGAMPGLNFNQKKAAIVAGSEAVRIDLSDYQAIIYEIEAPEHFDLTVEVSSPNMLTLESDPSKTIPFQLRISYNNMLAPDEQTGKLSAVELPLGFNSITFPVNRRISGAPGPPPTPQHGGYTRPKAKAYLYLYGVLGPVGAVPPGAYEGNVTINVSFANYEN